MSGRTTNGIREATLTDAESVGRLVSDLGYPTSPTAMRNRLASILADRDTVTLVAFTERGVVGVAGATVARYYERDGLYSRLLLLSVSPAARGLGLGRRLVEAVEQWAHGRGAKEVVVNSGFHRTGAHRFYGRCGYSRTGYRFVKSVSPG